MVVSPRMRSSLLCVLFCMCLTEHATADQETDTAQASLTSMSQALRNQTYSGLLTYEYGGVLASMRMVHVVRDGVAYSLLERLNGPERAPVQEHLAIGCIPVADQLLRGVLRPFGLQQGNLEQNYELQVRGQERIADRLAQVVQIIPRDPYRYGLIIAIDEQSSLPLQTLVVSPDKRVLERFQFVDLQVGKQVTNTQQLKATTAEQHTCPPGSVKPVASEQQDAVVTSAAPWVVDWIPSGFILTQVQKSAELGDVQSYSDGLSSFSVFIAPSDSPPLSEFVPGRALVGASVAYIHPVKFADHAYLITVVGEIPVQTAMRIAASVKSH